MKLSVEWDLDTPLLSPLSGPGSSVVKVPTCLVANSSLVQILLVVKALFIGN